MDLLLFSYSYLSVGVVSVRQGGGVFVRGEPLIHT